MTKKGNFFASMFIVLAAGNLIIYGIAGYATNMIAQVWHSLSTTIGVQC
jgi:ATP-binding cassette subfamily B (MDR/TAP) protein 1